MVETAQFGGEYGYADTPGYGVPAQPIGIPQPSSLDTGGASGGIGATLGQSLQGLSNIGLQWFTALTKGVSGPVNVPQPIQATPAAATANVVNQLTGYIPLILLLLAAIFIIKAFVK